MVSRGWRKQAPALLGVVASAAFIGLLCSTSGPFRSVSGRGVSAREANARLWNCPVPVAATDVWYTSAYRGTTVECTLGREEFEAWCRQEQWHPEPIEPGEPLYVSSPRDGLRSIDFGTLQGVNAGTPFVTTTAVRFTPQG